MWNKINDPLRQLEIGNKIKQIIDGIEEVYNIYEVEYDQFKIELLTVNGFQTKDKIQLTLSPETILNYDFLIEK